MSNKLEDFKIGTKVTIARNSQYFNSEAPEYSYNPSGISGLVWKIWDSDETDGDLRIGVHWSNGRYNGYNAEDLKILGVVVDEP